MKIGVGSQSESKVRAVALAAKSFDTTHLAEIVSIKALSGVSEQPIGLDETARGAVNRANFVHQETDCDVAVGMEGGVIEISGRKIDIGIVFVLGRSGLSGIGVSQGLALPVEVVDVMNSDAIDLSAAMQKVYNVDTIASRDCSSYLTNGRLPSDLYYQQATTSALEDYLRQL